MSTKPGSLPTWDTTLANVSAITAGHQTNGFLANAMPTSGELNTLFNFYYLWCQYLSDGNFQGTATFSSTLGVTGLITATGGITCAANTHVTVSGTGLYKHGTQTLVIPLIPNYQGGTTPNNTISLPAATSEVVWFILPVGKRVTAVRVCIIDSATGPTKLQCSTYTVTLPGMASTPQTVGAASAGTGAQQTISATGLTTVIAAGVIYGVYIARTTGSAVCSINNVEVDYDQP